MAKLSLNTLLSAFIILLLTISCKKILPASTPDDQILDGPIAGLSYEERRRFLAGDVAFNDEIFTPEIGLGPAFVATSCGSCHAGDGKGHPFSTLTRFGQSDETGNRYLNAGGPQLQDRAIPGYQPEKLPPGAPNSRFTPPANTGLGFLELVSDQDILDMADPDDLNKDGISGVPNYAILPRYITARLGSIPHNDKYIHHFGKKASTYNLLHQTVNAYNQDIGITSVFDPVDATSYLEIDPEISVQTIYNVVFYLQALRAPIQRQQNDLEVIEGGKFFQLLNCSGCHKPELKTGISTIPALSNKVFRPYTDLLLHDMGSALDDGYTEGSAKTYEWRTPPLWGLGLSPKSQGGRYFLLHDGRANSIDQAIQMHGGEAKRSQENYNVLSVTEKAALLKFLKSL